MKSYKKVPYDLRPAKQAERRILIDAFLQLSQAGFPIRDYKYLGFGSIFFYDYILFHKLLGIHDMTSIEGNIEDEARIEFNKPYKFITIEMANSTDVIINMSKDVPYILWLDYDEPLQEDQSDDISTAFSIMAPGSIFIITLDAEPPDKKDHSPEGTFNYYLDRVGSHLGLMNEDDFGKKQLPQTCAKMVNNIINNTLIGRPELFFYQLFNFVYSDTHRMITFGGMIGTKNDQRKLNGSGIYDNEYIRKNIKAPPFEIYVPVLTRKERVCLDSLIPLKFGMKELPFHLDKKDIDGYSDIYRFLPAYAELLV